MDALITVKTCYNRAEAELDKGMLQHHGIEIDLCAINANLGPLDIWRHLFCAFGRKDIADESSFGEVLPVSLQPLLHAGVNPFLQIVKVLLHHSVLLCRTTLLGRNDPSNQACLY